MQCPAGQYDTSRARDGVLPIPAPHLDDMNRRLVERTARIDRHDLIRLTGIVNLTGLLCTASARRGILVP
jgi:hypothetical protein